MTQWGLDNLFNPGKRHMDDEKRRLQSTREEIGDASGGRRIDLEAGTVSISVRRPAATPAADTDQDDDHDGTALDAALEAEEVPAVALANDEAEIAPEVVDAPLGEPAQPQDDVVGSVAAVEAVVDAPAPAEEPAAAPAPVAAVTPEPVAVVTPEPEPEPVPAAPKRRAQSARAWSRGG